MKRLKWSVSIPIALIVVAGLAMPADVAAQHAPVLLRVDPADPAAFASIQAAVDASQPGDTVEVAAGTYNESLRIGHDLVLRAAEGANVTLQDLANPEETGITLLGGNVVIEGLRIDYSGRGLWAIRTSSDAEVVHGDVTLRDLTVRGNMQAIQLEGVDDVRIEGVRLLYSQLDGIEVLGRGDALVVGNLAQGFQGNGADIFMDGNVSFRDNIARDIGGGFNVMARQTVIATNNTVERANFGIYAEGTVLRVMDNVIRDVAGVGIDTLLPIGPEGPGDHRVENNTLRNIGDWGILADTDWNIERQGTMVLANNSIDDATQWGMALFWDGEAQVVDNLFTNMTGRTYAFIGDCGAASIKEIHVARNVVRNVTGGLMISNEQPICTPGGPYHVENNHLENVRYHAISGGTQGAPFFIRHNVVHGTLGEPSGGIREALQVWAADHVEISHNILTDVHSAGGWIDAQGSVLLENNTLLAVDEGANQFGLEVSAGVDLVVRNNTVTGFGGNGLLLTSQGSKSIVQANRVGAGDRHAAVAIGAVGDLGGLSVVDNTLHGGIGILVRVTEQPAPSAELPYRFNDLVGTLVPLASCASTAVLEEFPDLQPSWCGSNAIQLNPSRAALNYYGPHGPPAESGLYAPIGVEPFLTAPPDPLRATDNVKTFGFFMHLDTGSGPIAVGAPGPMARSLRDMFDPGFEGIYYAFDELNQTWVQTLGHEVLGALEARVVVPQSPTRVLYDFADDPAQNPPRQLHAGWNLQAPRVHDGAARAFDDGVGVVLEVHDGFGQPVQQPDHDGRLYGPMMDEVWNTMGPIQVDGLDPCDGPFPAPFAGYFTLLAAPTTVEAAVPAGVGVDDWEQLLLAEPCVVPA